MGVSNGGRIAHEVEYRLRSGHQNPVKVSNIAGALLGTKKINLLKRLGLARLLYHDSVVNELSYLSEDALSRINNFREDTDRCRSFDFFASTEDSQIEPYSASLPLLNKGETFYVVHGVNHNSIVSAVAEAQVDLCRQWMEA
ncbi:MAG: hypothetical protein JJU12_06480 [Chlamydiales bacterium]|nr:hypothetical protein [Chlamydiales bacterium]